MYSFMGEYRTKPVVSLGGASKQIETNKLLEQNKFERLKREEQRNRVKSAHIILSVLRQWHVRQTQCARFRREFDEDVLSYNNTLTQSTQLQSHTFLSLTSKLLFFYHPDHDYDRLIWMGQCILNNPVITELFINSNHHYQLMKLLSNFSCILYHISTTQSKPVAIPLRVLETFLNPNIHTLLNLSCHSSIQLVNKLFVFLVRKGYFGHLKKLLESRLPNNLEKSSKPPTPLSQTLLDLIIQPVLLLCNTSTHTQDTTTRTNRDTVLTTLCIEIFSPVMCEQISLFLIPALSELKQDTLLFPLQPVLHILLHSLNYPTTTTTGRIDSTPYLLYSILTLVGPALEYLSVEILTDYLTVLQLTLSSLPSSTITTTSVSNNNNNSDGLQLHIDSDDDDIDTDIIQSTGDNTLQELRTECIDMVSSQTHVDCIRRVISSQYLQGLLPQTLLLSILHISHQLLVNQGINVHSNRLLTSLAYNSMFLSMCWQTIQSLSTYTFTGNKVFLIDLLCHANEMPYTDINRVCIPVTVFCVLFCHSLLSLHDVEFYGETPDGQSVCSTGIKFNLTQLVTMSAQLRDICISVVEIVYPVSRPIIRQDYVPAIRSIGTLHTHNPTTTSTNTSSSSDIATNNWVPLFRSACRCVGLLSERDTRKQYCPTQHWNNTSRVLINCDHISSQMCTALLNNNIPTFGSSHLNIDDDSPPLTTSEMRQLIILTEIPFVITFQERVKIFQKLIVKDRQMSQGSQQEFLIGPSINISVRREYLYEDAFDRLSLDNEPSLKKIIRVTMKNITGVTEAGIDGGGIFREFLYELLKAGFNPYRGFFKQTHHQLIYPNPTVNMFVDNYIQHFYFLGRMLGKALYENMLVELPFASFFLAKILKPHGDVDIHHLASLDPEMYKNLLFLKYYDGDWSDLALNFTVINNDLGETQVIELKPGGSSITVNEHNNIEYIHLMADYRLNRQIRTHCKAFRIGLANVVSLEYIRMFNYDELQVLISGAEVPINTEDMRKYTKYSGEFDETHTVIETFWSVVNKFTDNEKRQLLKFITSCSRPPLLGFKDLYPPICIHSAGNDTEGRLPTTSTCMNLLKLPAFQDERTMSDKLLYAIQSESGFELS